MGYLSTLRRTIYLAASLMVFSGCEGVLQEIIPTNLPTPAEPGQSVIDSESGSDTQAPGDSELSDLDPPQNHCATPLDAIADVPMRILTSPEINNALEALFPALDLPEVEMEHDTRINHFVLNSREQVTAAHVRQFRSVAESVAAAVYANVDAVAPCAASGDALLDCARPHIQGLAERAFRRSLEPTLVDRFMTLYEEGTHAGGHAEGMRWIVEAVLQAPSFMYVHEEAAGVDEIAPLGPYEIAQRMAAVLWRSLPDPALLEAARSGELSSPQGRSAQARRMLATSEGVTNLQSIMVQWLGVSDVDARYFPQGYDGETLARSMQAESARLAAHIIEEAGADWKKLLTARYTFVDAGLAAHYGFDLEGAREVSHGIYRVETPDRAGIMTQGAFLSRAQGPVHRGLTIRSNLLCSSIPGPEGIDTTAIPTEPGEAERSKSEKRLDNPSCAGCHTQMDLLGLPFEEYDAMGRLRSTDDYGNPVHGSGAVFGTDVDGAVNNANELIDRLARSENVRDCVARNLFLWAYGRTAGSADLCAVEQISSSLAAHDDDLREALVTIVSHHAFVQNVHTERTQ
jgi:hypothetical protein